MPGVALAAMALCTVAVAAQLAQPEAARRQPVKLAPSPAGRVRRHLPDR
ncbi:hypothetical protein LP419_22980 [Massilia sp. H-1]|nr:hypothetical protein LP419_22980 [Massilia sp. H-1]